MHVKDKIEFIKRHDPQGGERIERLFLRKERLKEGNAYGERFTERQFLLVFEPLLESAYERARIIETLLDGGATVIQLAERLFMEENRLFSHIRWLLKNNLIEIDGSHERDPIYYIKR